jgi:hypothetical protein
VEASGLAEVTDEEAAEIEKAVEDNATQDEEEDLATIEREQLEEEIRECTKACWGNLAACHIRLVRFMDLPLHHQLTSSFLGR